jgi:hypothetical protein
VNAVEIAGHDRRPIRRAVEAIFNERLAQDEKWGPEQTHPDGTGLWGDADKADAARAACEDAAVDGSLTWRDILCEEFNEALAESDPAALRAELIQVAAVCAGWVQDIDRRAA